MCMHIDIMNTCMCVSKRVKVKVGGGQEGADTPVFSFHATDLPIQIFF